MSTPEKLRVLLIDSLGHLKNPSLGFPKYSTVPAGLLYLASSLKERFGNRVETKVVNLTVDISSQKELESIMRDFSPRLVGIRSIVAFLDYTRDVIETARKVLPEALVVVGGPSTWGYCEELLSGTNGAHLGVIGDGEEAICQIAESLFSGSSPCELDGIVYEDNGELKFTPPRKPIADLDSIPFPDYSLVDLDKYASHLNYCYSLRKIGAICSSRGCPRHCIYCSNLDKDYRVRSPENVLKEMYQLHDKFGIVDFAFTDYNFHVDVARAEEILDLIISWDVKVNLYYPGGIRADTTTERLVDKMVKAGASWITYAVETASPRLQKYIRKNLDLDKARHIINYTFDRGVNVLNTFMFGFPTETYEEARLTIDFAKTLCPSVVPAVFAARFFKGTQMHQIAKEKNLDVEKINRAAKKFLTEIDLPPTDAMTGRELRMIYLEYFKEIFLEKNRLKKALERHLEHYTIEEVLTTYHFFLGRPFRSIDEILNYR